MASAFLLLLALMVFFQGSGDGLSSRGDIAVVEINGPIVESKEIVDQLDRVAKNKHIQGLLLRINSPGGGVGSSQEIYQAVLRVAKDKKVVASLGGIAASGGYYIAVAAHKIVANPGTVTGSIGVLMDYINVEQLLGFLRLHVELLTAGRLKDTGSPLKPLTPEDRSFLQSILDNMHAQFKKAVQEGRGLTAEQVDRLADGRIFTGEQAMKVGLVDQLGNRQTALDLAKELLGIEGEPKLLYPKKKPSKLLDLLIDGELETVFLKLYYSLHEGRALYLLKGTML
jgi:protease-4